MPTITKNCTGCGDPFDQPDYTNRNFCTSLCYYKYWMKSHPNKLRYLGHVDSCPKCKKWGSVTETTSYKGVVRHYLVRHWKYEYNAAKYGASRAMGNSTKKATSAAQRTHCDGFCYFSVADGKKLLPLIHRHP
jgi:hypothetical protein